MRRLALSRGSRRVKGLRRAFYLLGHATNAARAMRETPGTLHRVVPAHHLNLRFDA
ncbi:hypothetical protein [Paraburkholderia aromaticivorans]|uniref:hypothetical protein n=1 Tax=Paraburkholderia aromaticivorans TaxID=2026199 RepID=UPI0019803F23|nr:hypothetical protein [Paraburkholderia aromaticivorans]